MKLINRLISLFEEEMYDRKKGKKKKLGPRIYWVDR